MVFKIRQESRRNEKESRRKGCLIDGSLILEGSGDNPVSIALWIILGICNINDNIESKLRSFKMKQFYTFYSDEDWYIGGIRWSKFGDPRWCLQTFVQKYVLFHYK